jgi:hypothetical protein
MSFFTWFRQFAVVVAIAAFCGQAHAVNEVITSWTFQTAPPDDLLNSMTSPVVAADVGTGSASGLHASAETDWTTPAGNGSTDSFSSNNWGVDEYWQFSTSTTGFSDIGLRFDQTSSGTGPKDFQVQFSTDNVTYTPFTTYSSNNNGLSPFWNQNAPVVEDRIEIDLSSISALDNAATVYFRLVNSSTVSVNGGTVAATGTNRVDNFTVYRNFVPTPPPAPELPVAGDLVLGMNFGRPDLSVELVRGPRVADGGVEVGSPWRSQGFIHSVELDNKGGTLHNVEGNLLAVNEGTRSSAGVIANMAIYSLPTQGTPPLTPNQTIGTTGGASGVTLSRLTGLSVAPDNLKIAVAALDTGKVAVYDYTAGNSMGSGASLSGGRETAGTILTPTVPDDPGTAGDQTITYRYGTAWRDDNTVLTLDRDGELYSVNATTMATELKSSLGVPLIGGEYTALAYNPTVTDDYVYALYSGFNEASDPTSRNRLFVLNADTYGVVSTTDLSSLDTAALTGREIALDADGNLFIGTFSSEVFYIPDVVTNAASPGAPVSWYDSTNSSGFIGLDIGFAPPDVGQDGDHNGDGIVDAADYVAWRKMPNRYGGDPGGYDEWRANFGEGGAGSGGAVPEPACITMLAIGLAALCFRRRGSL